MSQRDETHAEEAQTDSDKKHRHTKKASVNSVTFKSSVLATHDVAIT